MQANTREALDGRGVEVVVASATESPCQVVKRDANNAMRRNSKRGRRQVALRGYVTIGYVSWWCRGDIYRPYGRLEIGGSLVARSMRPWPRGPDDGKASRRSVIAAAGSRQSDRRCCRGLSGRASAGRVAPRVVVVKNKHVHGAASSGSRRFRLQAWWLPPVQSWIDVAGR